MRIGLLVALLALGQVWEALAQQQVPNIECGVNWDLPPNADSHLEAQVENYISQLNCGTVRLSLVWFLYETSRGVYNLDAEAYFTRLLTHFESRGVQVILGISFPPAWSTGMPLPSGQNEFFYCMTNPTAEGCKQGDRPYPVQPDDARRLMNRIVDYFPTVDYVNFMGEIMGSRVFWQGTVDQFFTNMIGPARQVIEARGSRIKVVGPVEDRPDRLLALLGWQGGLGSMYFDVIAVNTYLGGGDTASFRGMIDQYRGIMMGAYLWRGKPFWVTEFGAWNADFAQQNQVISIMLETFDQHPWIERKILYRINPGQVNFGIIERGPGDMLSPTSAFETLKVWAARRPSRIQQSGVPARPGWYLAAVDARHLGDSPYILAANTAPYSITGEVFFRLNGGRVHAFRQTFGPNSRTNVVPRNIPEMKGEYASVSIHPERPEDLPHLLVELAGYRDNDPGRLWRSGYSIGATQLSGTWYFAEGAVGHPLFQAVEEIVLDIPQGGVDIVVSFLLEGGKKIERRYRSLRQGPYRIRVNDELLDRVDGFVPHATRIQAFVANTQQPVEISAARIMSWGYDGREAHATSGAPGLSQEWYFAEGSSSGFEGFITAANPNPGSMTVTLRYLRDGGGEVVRQYPIPANGRLTVGTGSDVPSGGYGIALTGDQPFVAEQPVYLGGGWEVGMVTMGSPRLATQWVLAEGAVSWFFNTYVLVVNPNPNPVTATVRFLTPGGSGSVVSLNVAANGRTGIPASRYVEGAFSVEVSAPLPIVVGRSKFWPNNGQPWYGGETSMGIPR